MFALPHIQIKLKNQEYEKDGQMAFHAQKSRMGQKMCLSIALRQKTISLILQNVHQSSKPLYQQDLKTIDRW